VQRALLSSSLHTLQAYDDGDFIMIIHLQSGEDLDHTRTWTASIHPVDKASFPLLDTVYRMQNSDLHMHCSHSCLLAVSITGIIQR